MNNTRSGSQQLTTMGSNVLANRCLGLTHVSREVTERIQERSSKMTEDEPLMIKTIKGSTYLSKKVLDKLTFQRCTVGVPYSIIRCKKFSFSFFSYLMYHFFFRRKSSRSFFTFYYFDLKGQRNVKL